MSTLETPTISKERAKSIIRKSIYTFLQHYQYFTCIPTFLALPFSISLLISQSHSPNSLSLLPTISDRLNSVFDAAGFPNSDPLFALVPQKLSQTLSTFILTLPFSISFLLLSKASVFHFFQKTAKNPCFLPLYYPLLTTHITNSILIFTVNSTFFSLCFLALTFLQDFSPSSSNWALFFTFIAFVFYSVVLANTLIVCNLSMASSISETHQNTGFNAILRACVITKGKTMTALLLAVPINLGMAAIEALFYIRIMKSSHNTQLFSVTIEGVFIGYMYSILLVLDVVMSYFFYQSCVNDNIDHELEVDDSRYYKNVDLVKLKVLEEFV